MGKEYIPLFLDFNETTQDLNDDECGRLIRAIVDYANGLDYQQRLIGAERIAFRFLKGLVDRNTAISEARSKAVSTRYRNAQEATNEQNDVQNPTNAYKLLQSDTKITIDTKTEIDTETNTKTKNKKAREIRFEAFWNAYPRHEGKANAKKAFDKIDPDDMLIDVMILNIEKQKQSAQWKENNGQFIPYPATWLNGKRWEDEVRTTSKTQSYLQRDYSGEQEAAIERMMAMGGEAQ